MTCTHYYYFLNHAFFSFTCRKQKQQANIDQQTTNQEKENSSWKLGGSYIQRRSNSLESESEEERSETPAAADTSAGTVSSEGVISPPPCPDFEKIQHEESADSLNGTDLLGGTRASARLKARDLKTAFRPSVADSMNDTSPSPPQGQKRLVTSHSQCLKLFLFTQFSFVVRRSSSNVYDFENSLQPVDSVCPVHGDYSAGLFEEPINTNQCLYSCCPFYDHQQPKKIKRQVPVQRTSTTKTSSRQSSIPVDSTSCQRQPTASTSYANQKSRFDSPEYLPLYNRREKSFDEGIQCKRLRQDSHSSDIFDPPELLLLDGSPLPCSPMPPHSIG